MRINVPPFLEELASLFPKPLYAVGGFVRDALLGYEAGDIDVASSLAPDEVKTLLTGTSFLVKDGSKKLLTLIIRHGKNEVEYTTFRTDSYGAGHRPEKVVPTADIRADARRRDFTVNAIYYDIKSGCLVDILGGIGDLNEKILRTTRAAKDVFSEDGLRLMRLARFAASLGFTCSEDALKAAKENAPLIDDISKERVKDELNKILIGDTLYGVKNAPSAGIDLLREIGVLKRILPDICDGIGMEQRPDFHAYDVYGHILHTIDAASPSVRLAALFHDIAKPYMKITTGRYAGHDKQGGIMTRRIMTDLKYSVALTEETARLVENHMFNLNNDVRANTLRRFIVKNRDILDKLIALKYADYIGSGTAKTPDLPSADRIRAEYEKMLLEGVPFSVKDLLVSGDDLLSIEELPPAQRGDALNALLDECVLENSPYLHNRQKQLDFIIQFARRKPWITK